MPLADRSTANDQDAKRSIRGTVHRENPGATSCKMESSGNLRDVFVAMRDAARFTAHRGALDSGAALPAVGDRLSHMRLGCLCAWGWPFNAALRKVLYCEAENRMPFWTWSDSGRLGLSGKQGVPIVPDRGFDRGFFTKALQSWWAAVPPCWCVAARSRLSFSFFLLDPSFVKKGNFGGHDEKTGLGSQAAYWVHFANLTSCRPGPSQKSQKNVFG